MTRRANLWSPRLQTLHKREDYLHDLSIFLILCCVCVFNVIPGNHSYKFRRLGEDNGNPLFLTPFLERGDFDEARRHARVEPLLGDVESYSGFFTVNKTYNSNIFFWFFPAIKSPETAPVVVWLQGGPGTSSLFGLFDENGPYTIKDHTELALRKHSWTKTLSMLYIDSPVGAGFSFTDHDDGYARNQEDVGTNLYKTVVQFFHLFPNLLKNDFYVASESYGGKFGPALAYTIHEKNKVESNMKINLKGIAIGNGYCDPVNMLDYGIYLYQIGLIDVHEKAIFEQKQEEIKQLTKSGKLSEAYESLRSLIKGDDLKHLSGQSSNLFVNVTGFHSPFNFLYTEDMSSSSNIVNENFVRRKIHVGDLIFNSDGESQPLHSHLKEDFLKSVAPWIEVLLDNNYKVMVYNGQLDIIVAYPLTIEFLRNLKWNGADEYKSTPRHIWRIDPLDVSDIAGYVRRARNLVEVLVRNAGHMVPSDQPISAFDLINRFVFEKWSD